MHLRQAEVLFRANVRASPVRQAACAVLAAVWLAGCATAPQVPAGESIAVTVTLAADSAAPIRIRNDAVSGRSVEGLVGGGAGAVAGGLWGLACGPLAGLCVPLGAMLGADVGILAGLAVGTTAALPEDKKVLLTERVGSVLQSRDVRGALEADVVERAQAQWKVNGPQSTWVVDVELVELSLSSTRDERVRWVAKVLVDAHRAGTAPAPRGKRRAYERAGTYGTLASWLDEGVDSVDSSLVLLCRELAAQIVSDLTVQLQPGSARQ